MLTFGFVTHASTAGEYAALTKGLKDVVVNIGEAPKLGSAELGSLGMGGVANHEIHVPRHVLPRQIW